jgi:hypothetical protein
MISPATPIPPPGIKLSVALLVALILGDVLFMAVHVLHVWSPWFKSWMFSIEQDRSLGELFQYLKQCLLTLCLALAFARSRRGVFAGWAVLFGFLLLDDMLEFHERFGRLVGPQLGLPTLFGLRPDDYGELVYAALLGLAALGFVTTTLRHGDAVTREVSADMMCLLALLAFFAVFFDALHTMAYFSVPAVADAVALLEDGGEMLVMSVIAAYAFDTWRNGGLPRVSIWTWVRGRGAPAPA